MYFITITVRRRAEIFKDNVIAKLAYDSLRYQIEKLYKCNVYSFVVMPDHIHLLADTTKWIYRFKGFIAKKVIEYMTKVNHQELFNFFLKKSYGNFRWHRLWDKKMCYRKINNEKDFLNCIEYIKNNPVKAGLVRNYKDYPWLYCKEK